MPEHILHLNNPATEWENSTPVGCGTMGMSVFGRTGRELLYLNEDTIWADDGVDGTDPDFRDKLDRVRALFLEGKNDEGELLAEQLLKNSFSSIRSYETAGRLVVDFGGRGRVKSYSRDIDMLNGVADINYVKNGSRVHTQAFASYPDKVMCYRFTSDKAVNFTVKLERELITSQRCEDGLLTIQSSTLVGDHPFCVSVRICTDGALTHAGGFRVAGATWAVLYIGIATKFRTDDYVERSIEMVAHKAAEYDALLKRHSDDFSAVMRKSNVSFETDEHTDALPVSKRLSVLRKNDGACDMGLISTYFDFGKYLLVSSSRPGSMPANLQGVWAEKYKNPWNSNYTININTQMNYWPAEVANLSCCHDALFDFLNNILLPSGQKTALVNYRAHGTVAHHISNIYGFSAPGDGLWGQWPMGGAWFAYHLWEHYLFTGDTEFLKNKAYNYIKNCVLFFADYLFDDGKGHLVSGPAASPENSYVFGDDRKKVNLSLSPTMDTEIIGGLLSFYIKTEEILDIDSAMKEKAQDMLSRLVPLQVGKYGQLMEWNEDYEESDPGHRHISHAFGLYPGSMITRAQPELFDAIQVTLERRLANGGGHTGWSRAWLINLFARLRNGEKALENLRLLFVRSTRDNLFDSHPPFQIDGNFGGTAAICEMLIQSHEGFISLLPAVTEEFSGSFSGLCVRGGIEVSADFKGGLLTDFTLVSARDAEVRVELPDRQKEGFDCGYKNEDGFILLKLKQGEPLFVCVTSEEG